MVQERIIEATRKRKWQVVVVIVCVVVGMVVGLYFLICYMADESLRERLESRDPEIRAKALYEAYRRWGGRIIERVFKELSAPSDTVRNAADHILRHYLKRHPDRRMLERLRALWADDKNDTDLRERALHLLAAVADKSWEDFFFSPQIWELDNPTSMWWDAASRYFERVADDRTYKRLLEWAKAPDPQKNYTAAFLSRFVFKCFSKEQVERLVDALAPLLVHQNGYIRAEAAATLYKHLTRKHKRYILQALQEEGGSNEAIRVREHMIETVRRLRLREAADRLYRIVLNDIDDRVVQRAAAALATLGSEKFFNLAVSLLERGAPLRATNLAGVMALVGRMGGARAVRALASCLMRRNPRMVKEAGTWLALAEPAAEDALIKALKAPTVEGRLNAFKILCNWGVKEAIPTLIATALKERPAVAENMLLYLQYFPDCSVVDHLLAVLKRGIRSARVRAAVVDVLAFYRTPEAVCAVADALVDDAQEVTNTAQAKLSDIARSLRRVPDNLSEIIKKVIREFVLNLSCPSVREFLINALPQVKSISVARDILFEALRKLKLQTSILATLTFRDDKNNIQYAIGNMLCDYWTMKLAQQLRKRGVTDLQDASYKVSAALTNYDPTGIEKEQNRQVVEQIKAALGLKR